uniref:Uncharacterized protein n=1 Tax=Arundo donax TaxID=35708 RepID=A0A0A8YWQ2_ARUDO
MLNSKGQHHTASQAPFQNPVLAIHNIIFLRSSISISNACSTGPIVTYHS